MSNRLSLEQLLDEREIEAVLVKYATCLDEHHWAGLDEVFVADATATYHGIGDFGSRDAIRNVETQSPQAACARARSPGRQHRPRRHRS